MASIISNICGTISSFFRLGDPSGPVIHSGNIVNMADIGKDGDILINSGGAVNSIFVRSSNMWMPVSSFEPVRTVVESTSLSNYEFTTIECNAATDITLGLPPAVKGARVTLVNSSNTHSVVVMATNIGEETSSELMTLGPAMSCTISYLNSWSI